MIEVNYTLTARDMATGVRLLLRHTTFQLPGRIIGYLMLIFWVATLPRFWSPTVGFMYYAMPLVAIIMAFGDYIFASIVAYSAAKVGDVRTYRVQFTDQHCRYESPGMETTLSWTNVTEVLEYRDGFIICTNKVTGNWIPRRVFSDSGEEFRALLQSSNVKIKKP